MYSCLYEISSDTDIFNFGYLSSGHSVYMCKDARICGYFLKSKGVLKQKSEKHCLKLKQENTTHGKLE